MFSNALVLKHFALGVKSKPVPQQLVYPVKHNEPRSKIRTTKGYKADKTCDENKQFYWKHKTINIQTNIQSFCINQQNR